MRVNIEVIYSTSELSIGDNKYNGYDAECIIYNSKNRKIGNLERVFKIVNKKYLEL